VVQGRGNAYAVLPARPQRPPAQRDVTDVVDDQKRHDRSPAGAQTDRGERETRQERQPAGPDQAVTDRAERPAQGAAQTLDQIGRRPVVLGTRGGPDRQAGEVRMRVEKVRARATAAR